MGSAAWWVEGKSCGWGRLAACMVFCKHWRTKEYTSPCVCGYLSLLFPGKFHSIPKLNNMTLFMKRLVNNTPPSLHAHSYNVGNALICLQVRDLQLGQATIVVMLSSLTARPIGASAMKLGLPKLQWSCYTCSAAFYTSVTLLDWERRFRGSELRQNCAAVLSALLLFLSPKACLSSGEGNGSPLQYSCPENPMDGGAG